MGEPETRAAKLLFQQLAEVYVQLRQLEFPQIGSLGLPCRAVSALTCDPDEIVVRHRPLSMEVAIQELDGIMPGDVIPPGMTMGTAAEFVDALLRLVDNKLHREPDQGMDEFEPASILYAADGFKRYIRDEWVDQLTNEGPFVLGALKSPPPSSYHCPKSQLSVPTSA